MTLNERIVEMWDNGYFIAEIAKELGIHRNTVVGVLADEDRLTFPNVADIWL